MCKSCVNNTERFRTSLSISSGLSTTRFFDHYNMGKTYSYTQTFNHTVRVFIHYLTRQIQSVISEFSTISTHPTITTTNSLNS
jgi:hypothetical protein